MDFNIYNLKESNLFLNSILQSITSAIFIVDKNIKIQNFNDPFSTLFHREEDKIIGELCGNAIGCAFTVDENKNCGTTSNCSECDLKISLLKVFTEKVPTYRGKIIRGFHINNKTIVKHFQFSTKFISYNDEEMALIIIDDITESEEQKEFIKIMSNVDYLTQLYNRRYFFDIGNKFFENAKRNNISIAVVLIDIDNFKKVNDSYGHRMGDAILKNISEILVKNVREGDIISRYGGEEFCLILTFINVENSYRVIERIRVLIEELEYYIDDEKVKVTISSGITNKMRNSLQETINVSDKLLIEAKNNGKNQIQMDE